MEHPRALGVDQVKLVAEGDASSGGVEDEGGVLS